LAWRSGSLNLVFQMFFLIIWSSIFYKQVGLLLPDQLLKLWMCFIFWLCYILSCTTHRLIEIWYNNSDWLDKYLRLKLIRSMVQSWNLTVAGTHIAAWVAAAVVSWLTLKLCCCLVAGPDGSTKSWLSQACRRTVSCITCYVS